MAWEVDFMQGHQIVMKDNGKRCTIFTKGYLAANFNVNIEENIVTLVDRKGFVDTIKWDLSEDSPKEI